MDIPNLFPISKVGLEVPLSVVFLILRASVDRALPVHIYAPSSSLASLIAFVLAVKGILTMALGHKAVTQMILWYSEIGAPPTQYVIREFCSRLQVQVYIDHALNVSPTSVICSVESILDMEKTLIFFLERDKKLVIF